MKTETAMNKKNVITAAVPSNLTLEKIWDRVISRRPAGCYHIRMVSASDERTIEIMPDYEGWSSVIWENNIAPGIVGRGFVNYVLSREDIVEFPVGRVEFLIAEEDEELILEDEEYNPPYNSLEAREYLRDRSKEAYRAKFVCREIGKLIASMQEANFGHQIEEKLDLVMEGMAKEQDFRHESSDCLSVTAIKDVAVSLIRFLSGVGSEVDAHHAMWSAREILRARKD